MSSKAHTVTDSAASSINSILSSPDWEPEDAIRSGGLSTPVLVVEAWSIAKRMRNVILVSNATSTVYVGVFLEALLDYASKMTFPIVEA